MPLEWRERIFGSGELQGGRDFEGGVYESGEGNGKISLQQGGFQVSEGGTNGEQKEIEESKKQGNYSGLVVIYGRVHNECL